MAEQQMIDPMTKIRISTVAPEGDTPILITTVGDACKRFFENVPGSRKQFIRELERLIDPDECRSRAYFQGFGSDWLSAQLEH
ncbi:MAG TPA: hypothetical protein VK973_05850 [Arenicellales bacterium]|nr:hypothetical protein [Arenicellales bacterium]